MSGLEPYELVEVPIVVPERIAKSGSDTASR
jgi:hypothetical protein